MAAYCFGKGSEKTFVNWADRLPVQKKKRIPQNRALIKFISNEDSKHQQKNRDWQVFTDFF